MKRNFALHRGLIGKKVVLCGVLALLCAVLVVSCAIYFLSPPKDALSFYKEFLPTEKLYVNEKNELIWEYLDDGRIETIKLKYADKLEFRDYYKADIQITGVHGRTIEYDITNLTDRVLELSGDVILLKYIDGAWYILPNWILYRNLSVVDEYLYSNYVRHREVCLGFGAGVQRIRQDDDLLLWRCNTIPEGQYALFFEARKPEIKGESEIAVGGALIQFELEKSEPPKTYDVDTLSPFAYGDGYLIGNISETLYNDPFNK